MEPLEIDDINFFPCTCGYQVCRKYLCCYVWNNKKKVLADFEEYLESKILILPFLHKHRSIFGMLDAAGSFGRASLENFPLIRSDVLRHCKCVQFNAYFILCISLLMLRLFYL